MKPGMPTIPHSFIFRWVAAVCLIVVPLIIILKPNQYQQRTLKELIKQNPKEFQEYLQKEGYSKSDPLKFEQVDIQQQSNHDPVLDSMPKGPVKCDYRERDRDLPVIKRELDVLPVDEILKPNLITSTIIYVWCGKRWFEFQHYLSMMSVIKIIRPDNIRFFYDFYPITDSWTYNTWFKELREEFPFLFVREMGKGEHACINSAVPNATYIKGLIQQYGGMYVNEHTVFNQFPAEWRSYDVVTAGNATHPDLLMGKIGSIEKPKSNIHEKQLDCFTTKKFETAAHKPPCVKITERVFPNNFWETDSDVGKLVRNIFYDNPEIPKVRHSTDTLIPNIAHIVWLGGGKMDFLFYMCVLSLLYVADVENLYIHGDKPPTGMYWEKVKNHPRLHHIYREWPVTIYGTNVDVLSHVTDIWRVDFMIKYGGIYVDTDTAFVKPLDTFIRGYDAVGTYDWTYWNHPFPDTINFGVAIGKRNAEYWHRFQQSMKWFDDKDWSWNGLRQPYRIKERFPHLVKIDPALQVTCFEYKCHPTWWPNYHNESIHHLNSPSIKDWRKDAYAFHWTLPTPPELRNEVNLMSSNTMFADIARFIFEKAGVLDEIKSRAANKNQNR